MVGEEKLVIMLISKESWDLSNVLKKSWIWTAAVVSALFTFVPEALFNFRAWIPTAVIENSEFLKAHVDEINIVISKIATFAIVFVVAMFVRIVYMAVRRKVVIKGNNYIIQVEYGDLFKKSSNSKRVISFDECFSTHVGNAPEDINPNSICGQYLSSHPDLNMKALIEQSDIKEARSASKFKRKTRYESGTVIPYEDDLLLAFAKLDEKGLGRFESRDDYLNCLSRLWEELDCYYGQKDVCIPVLGAGVTRFESASGASLSQQELLDIIILSYRLNSHKIKKPNKLRIICRKSDDFSINRIGVLT